MSSWFFRRLVCVATFFFISTIAVGNGSVFSYVREVNTSTKDKNNNNKGENNNNNNNNNSDNDVPDSEALNAMIEREVRHLLRHSTGQMAWINPLIHEGENVPSTLGFDSFYQNFFSRLSLSL